MNGESFNVNNESTNSSNTSTTSKKINENVQVTLTPADKEQITGYRLIDMEILSFIFSVFWVSRML